jgi:hypothetical protein
MAPRVDHVNDPVRAATPTRLPAATRFTTTAAAASHRRSDHPHRW